MSMPCPVCGSISHVRTSRPMSPVTREQYFHCTNERCHHVFVAMVSIIRTVGSSLLPQDEQSGWPHGIHVPKSPRTHPPSPMGDRQLKLAGLGPSG